jgi:hypothetical protein
MLAQVWVNTLHGKIRIGPTPGLPKMCVTDWLGYCLIMSSGAARILARFPHPHLKRGDGGSAVSTEIVKHPQHVVRVAPPSREANKVGINETRRAPNAEPREHYWD